MLFAYTYINLHVCVMCDTVLVRKGQSHNERLNKSTPAMMTIVQILGALMPRVPGTSWTLVVMLRAKFSSSNLNLICSNFCSKGETMLS